MIGIDITDLFCVECAVKLDERNCLYCMIIPFFLVIVDMLNDSHDSIGLQNNSSHSSDNTPVLAHRTDGLYNHDRALTDMHNSHHKSYHNGSSMYANGPLRREYDSHTNLGYDQADTNDLRFRSRTPGPDFMRGNQDDMFSRSHREVARSKTPTNDGYLYGKKNNVPHDGSGSTNFGSHATASSGTPDFIPASRYTSPPSPRGTGTIPYRQQNHDRGKPRPVSSGPDLTSSAAPMSGMNSSQTYSGGLNYLGHPNHSIQQQSTHRPSTHQPGGISPSSSGMWMEDRVGKGMGFQGRRKVFRKYIDIVS